MKRSGRLALGCAGVAVAMAALAMWTWGAGVADLLTSAHYRPIAPAAALLLGCISLAIFLFQLRPHDRVVIRLACGTVAFVALAGLFVGVRHWFGWASPLEDWLVQALGQVSDPKGSPMSPVSGGLLVVVALAFALRLPPLGRRPNARLISCALGGLVALAGGALAANHAWEKPWLVGGFAMPMALWTAFTFAFLGLALLSPLSADDWQPSEIRSESSATGADTLPLTLVGLLALAIAVLGAGYLRWEQAEIRGEAHDTLETIAKVKVTDISNWREERLGDARFFSKAAFVARDAQAFFGQPNSALARADLVNWLTLLKAGDRYASVELYDTNHVRRLGVPEQTVAPNSRHPELFAALLQTNAVIMTDLHRGGEAGDIHLSLAFPVFAPGDPAAAPDRRQPLGLVLIRLDPRQFLYPLIRSWPTHSASAETVLFRREGNEIVFLNELRHRANSALNLRFPVEPDTRLPAALAVMGQSGTVEGLDYRGVPVVASIRRVPHSPWFVIAKVDQAEIYAPLRAQAWLVLGLTALLAVTAGLLVWLLSKRREAARARRELAAERQRRILAERVEHLMKSANDIILLADDQWRILEANDRALEAYGWSLAELQRMSLPDLRTPETRGEFAAQAARLVAEGRILIEAIHQRKDGSTFPVENSARIIEIGGARYNLAIVRDITRRKAREREIKRMNRLFAVLSQVNQVIVRTRQREELLAEVCHIIVRFGGFKLAWVGWLDRATQSVAPVASAGEEVSFLRLVTASAGDRPEGRGPIGVCIREARPVIRNDLINASPALPWQDEAIRRGFRASAAFPISGNGAVAGALVVYADEPHVFGDQEVELLAEAAGDIAFGLENLERERLRQQAELALRENEVLLREMSEMAHIGGWQFDPATGRGTWTDEIARIHDLDPATEATAELGLSVFHGEWRRKIEAAIREALESGKPYDLELEMVTAKGNRKWVRTIGFPARQDGRVVKLRGAMQDITDRKRAAEALRESEGRYRELVQNANSAIIRWRRDGTITFFNEYAQELFGYPEQEALGRSVSLLVPAQQSDGANLEALIESIVNDPAHHAFNVNENVCRDGRRVWMAWTNKPIFDARGQVREILAVGCDITDRKRAEEALRESDAHYRLLADNVEDFVTVVDAQENRLYLSPSFFRVTGWTAEEVLPTAWNARLHPDDLPIIQQSRAANQAGQTTLIEHRVLCRDGSWMWVEARCKPISGPDGRMLQLLIWQHDITERRRAEEALRASEARLRTLGDNVPGGALYQLLAPPDGRNRYTYMSTGIERIFGLSAERVMADPAAFWALIVQEDRPGMAAAQERSAREMTLFDCEFRQRTVTGEVKWLHARSMPRRIEDGSILWDGVVADITERKRAEQAIQTLNAELEHRVLKRTAELQAANKELEAFSYSVSHDLRAPLRTVDGFSQALVEDYGPQLPEEARRYLHLVRQGAQRMGQLIDDLLAFSRLSRQPLHKREVDTAGQVREALKDLRAEQEGRQLELNIGPLPACQGDPALLKQVWVNLLANAFKYTRRRERASVEAGCRVQAGETVFFVKDNGTGFDMRYAHKLFGVFQRLHRAEDFEGTGVGLAIVQRIVHRHGGRVWAEARPDQGATFYFTLETQNKSES